MFQVKMSAENPTDLEYSDQSSPEMVYRARNMAQGNYPVTNPAID